LDDLQTDRDRAARRRGQADLALSQLAFYSGARGVLKVLDRMIAEGDFAALHKTFQRQGSRISRIQARRPQAKYFGHNGKLSVLANRFGAVDMHTVTVVAFSPERRRYKS
jgi:hypothetical protein